MGVCGNRDDFEYCSDYDDYKKKDKIDISRYHHIRALMKYDIREWGRRDLQKGSLKMVLSDDSIAWELIQILNSGNCEVIKKLYNTIHKVFHDYLSRFTWISFHQASKRLGVSIRIIKGFVWCGLLMGISIDGKNKVNGADVVIVKDIKEDYPEEFENIKDFVMSYFKSARKQCKVNTSIDKVICGRNKFGNIPVIRKDNVLHLGLTKKR